MVREGYKRTEVGIIPKDWKIESLSSVCTFLDNQRKPVKASDREKMRGIYPYYGASGIVDYVDSYLFDDQLILLAEDGENILSRSSAIAFIAKGKFWVNNHAHVLKPKEGHSLAFICDYLESLDYREFNSGTAQPKINKANCSNILLAVPPPEEQKAIAGALSDADALIEFLEKLIAKKRAIKTATMQELLKGKTRLPGFSESNEFKESELGRIPKDWNLGTISSFAQITTGDKNTQDKINDGKYPFIVRSDKVERINSWSFDGEAILTAGDGVGTGKIFHYLTGKFDYHQRVYNIHGFAPEVNGKYFYWQFSENFFDRIMSMTAKSSVDSVRREMISNMLIPIPKIAEQLAIADILSDMDAECAKLERRLETTRSVKQGMMQELLTGRTRLVL